MDTSIGEEIRRRCRELDVPLVGFAPADAWDTPRFEPWVPPAFRPASIYPEARSVVVIGLPIFLPVLETSPSIAYFELYRTVNTLLDSNAYLIALLLNRGGFPSIPVPRDGYGSIQVLREKPLAFFSHRHAAYLAGLGNFGVSNMLLTPEYGPRVRFASVLTAAELPAGNVMEEQLCIRCMRCRDICPVHALGSDDYPADLTEKGSCATRSEELAGRFVSPCGFCIKVCPVGEDRTVFHRTGMDIYDEKNPKYHRYHRAWDHVRSHGSR